MDICCLQSADGAALRSAASRLVSAVCTNSLLLWDGRTPELEVGGLLIDTADTLTRILHGV